MTAFFECGPFTAEDGEGRVLLNGLSLCLDEGQSVAIEGPSGGGKSTLLRHLTALAYSPEAERRLEGEAFAGADLAAWRARVSLAAQDAPMISGTVRDNLAFPFAQRSGRQKRFDDGAASAMLARVALEAIPLDREVRTISGGERHRLALARALLWDPQVLVADEPLAGLDPEIASACLELLLDFAHRPGRLLVCVFHDPVMIARTDLRFRLSDGGLREIS
jgi:putative ABC transport system ATP-binding protein